MTQASTTPTKEQFINTLTQEQKALFGTSIDGIYRDFTKSKRGLSLQEYIDERVDVRKAMQEMKEVLKEPEVMAVFKRLKNK